MNGPTDAVPGGMKNLLAKGAFWIAATRALVNLIGFISMLFLARFLAPEDFGVVAIASTISTIILAVSELSLSSALVFHKQLTDDHFHTAFSLNLLRGVVLAAIILSLAWPISWLYGDPRLLSIMLVLGCSALIGGLLNPKLIVFSRELIFWQEFALGVSQKLIGFLISATVAVLFRTYWALLAGIVATQITGAGLSYVVVSYRPRFRLSKVRELLSFSVWLTLGQAINTLNWKFDHLVIGYFLGSTTLGYYTVGESLALLPTREATLPISQALFPSFAKLNHDLPRLRNAFQQAQALLCVLAFPLGCGFALVARPFVELAMGQQWTQAIVIIQLLSCIFAMQTMIYGLQPLGMAMGQTRQLLQRDLMNVAIRVPFIVIGLLAYGLVGIILARCASGLISILISMTMVRKLLGISVLRQLETNVRPAISVVIMAAGAYLVGQDFGIGTGTTFLIMKIIAVILSGAVIYTLSLSVLWWIMGKPAGAEEELFCLVAKSIKVLIGRTRFAR